MPPFESDSRRLGRKVVVLDDDPTGSQTVHDIDILTEASVESLAEALSSSKDLFYILTNSRALPPDQAEALNVEIAENLSKASLSTGRPFDLVSRSDSTLRGHYPLEIDALAKTLKDTLGWRFDGHILIPFFHEGGRFTVGDVHWVQEGDRLLPAAQTEYAKDPAFPYTASDLRQWVLEKTNKRYSLDQIVSLSLQDLRSQGPEWVARQLSRITGNPPVIVNCASYGDLQVFVRGLLQACLHGKRFLFRTAASFVKVRGAIDDRPLLTSREMIPAAAPEGGCVFVGSFVQKTSRQIEVLKQLPGTSSVELRVSRIFDPGTRSAEIQGAARILNEAVLAGKTGMVYTSRSRMNARTPQEAAVLGQAISSALVEVARRVHETPRFIVAKGGITASDIATQGLGIRRARVLGQILPGVPVWRPDAGSRFPNVPYVVFPGNVGEVDAMARTVERLH